MLPRSTKPDGAPARYTSPMKLADLNDAFQALADEEVRYLVVGGLAVNVHGLRRLTQGLDILIQLVAQNVERVFKALQRVGFRPNVPVTADQRGNPRIREAWIRDKGMQVLNFFSAAHPATPVDVFVSEPFAFDEEFGRSVVKPLNGIEVRVVSLETLVKMKESVGRAQDRIDVENLKLRRKPDERA